MNAGSLQVVLDLLSESQDSGGSGLGSRTPAWLEDLHSCDVPGGSMGRPQRDGGQMHTAVGRHSSSTRGLQEDVSTVKGSLEFGF
ncbi:hypothetical protein GN956_G22767 [Arapaima gigas]